MRLKEGDAHKERLWKSETEIKIHMRQGREMQGGRGKETEMREKSEEEEEEKESKVKEIKTKRTRVEGKRENKTTGSIIPRSQ